MPDMSRFTGVKFVLLCQMNITDGKDGRPAEYAIEYRHGTGDTLACRECCATARAADVEFGDILSVRTFKQPDFVSFVEPHGL